MDRRRDPRLVAALGVFVLAAALLWRLRPLGPVDVRVERDEGAAILAFDEPRADVAELLVADGEGHEVVPPLAFDARDAGLHTVRVPLAGVAYAPPLVAWVLYGSADAVSDVLEEVAPALHGAPSIDVRDAALAPSARRRHAGLVRVRLDAPEAQRASTKSP